MLRGNVQPFDLFNEDLLLVTLHRAAKHKKQQCLHVLDERVRWIRGNEIVERTVLSDRHDQVLVAVECNVDHIGQLEHQCLVEYIFVKVSNIVEQDGEMF